MTNQETPEQGGAMGRAIGEAEDRRSLAEARANGWPIVTRPVQGGATEEQIEAAARAEAERRYVPLDRPTAVSEQCAVQGFVDGAKWSVSVSADPADEHHDAEEREAEVGAAFLQAASAERRTHEARGWTREHDVQHGPEHPLRLALDYLANGKPVKAGALILAALDVLSAQAEPEDHAATVTGDREKLIADALEEAALRITADDDASDRIDGEAEARAEGFNDAMAIMEPYVQRLAALAAPGEVDETKLAEVIEDERRGWTRRGSGKSASLAHAVAEWLRGEGR